jgi:hypothetical protein
VNVSSTLLTVGVEKVAAPVAAFTLSVYLEWQILQPGVCMPLVHHCWHCLHLHSTGLRAAAVLNAVLSPFLLVFLLLFFFLRNAERFYHHPGAIQTAMSSAATDSKCYDRD